MDEVIIEPPATKLLIEHLQAELLDRGDPAKVSGKVQDGPCVVVKLIGGSLSDVVVSEAVMAFDCYDPLQERAEARAGLVGAIVRAMRGTVVGGVAIYEVTSIGRPGNLPDPVTESPRWTQTISIFMRASAE